MSYSKPVGLSKRPFGGFPTNMHWQTYQYDGALTPTLEETLRNEASRALTRKGAGPLGFSVSTSLTTINGITSGMTEFQIGKGVQWTLDETDALDKKFASLAPHGQIRRDGHSLYFGTQAEPRIQPVDDIAPVTGVARRHTHGPRSAKVPASTHVPVYTQDYAYPDRESAASHTSNKVRRGKRASAPPVAVEVSTHQAYHSPLSSRHRSSASSTMAPTTPHSHHSHSVMQLSTRTSPESVHKSHSRSTLQTRQGRLTPHGQAYPPSTTHAYSSKPSPLPPVTHHWHASGPFQHSLKHVGHVQDGALGHPHASFLPSAAGHGTANAGATVHEQRQGPPGRHPVPPSEVEKESRSFMSRYRTRKRTTT